MKLALKLRKFWKDEEGANGVEYALLAGLIAIGFVVGAGALGLSLNTFLDNVSTCVTTPTVGNCSAPFGDQQPMTQVQYRKGHAQTAAAIAARLRPGVELVPSTSLSGGTDIRLVLGHDVWSVVDLLSQPSLAVRPI